MAKTDATVDRTNNRLSQKYQFWFTGDGATVEFRLPKTIGRLDDLSVTVDGSLKRPDLNLVTTFDYAVRGITVNYTGDKNAIKFHSAPANGKSICVTLHAT